MSSTSTEAPPTVQVWELEAETPTAARALARRTLTAQLPPGAELACDPDGRLRVVGAPDLSFSVSHAGRRALVALLRGGGRVGVDLEVHRPGRNFTAIAAACFPPDTARRLFGRLESPEFLADFYDEWTRYEAATKVAGGSILYPEGIPRGPGLEFRTLPVWPGHSAALCLRY